MEEWQLRTRVMMPILPRILEISGVKTQHYLLRKNTLFTLMPWEVVAPGMVPQYPWLLLGGGILLLKMARWGCALQLRK